MAISPTLRNVTLYPLLSRYTIGRVRIFLILRILKYYNLQFQLSFSSKAEEIPKNALKDVISADAQKENGIVYDKKPFKLALEAGK